MSLHKSTSSSAGVKSRKGINANTLVLKYHLMEETRLNLIKNSTRDNENPEKKIGTYTNKYILAS